MGTDSAEYSLLAWLAFNCLMAAMLWLDIQANRVESTLHPVRQAAAWSALWVAIALLFALLLAMCSSPQDGLTFLVGYLVEKSLSVDNLLVMLLIFKSFGIKPGRQPRVLKWGIIGAIVMRAVFIFAGIEILERFEWAIYLFGLVLLYAAYKTLKGDDDDEDEAAGSGIVLRLLQMIVPFDPADNSTDFLVCRRAYEGHAGRWVATPMFAALLVVEFCDVIFAVDSIPCILGLTKDRFLVYTSNMLAILGLRSLYLVLADALHKVKHLQTGLGVILGFVGLKMILADLFPIPQVMSLLFIAGVLLATVLLGGVGSSPTNKSESLLG